MKKRHKNTSGLIAYSTQRNQETLKKIDGAIERLKRSKSTPINFRTVAEEAGVAKTTLYNNAVVKERIMSLRSIQKSPLSPENMEAQRSCRMVVKQLNEEVRQLREEKKKLIVQLVEMEVLRDENERLKDALEKVRLQN